MMTDSGIDWGKLISKWKTKLKQTGFFPAFLKAILTITILYSLGYFLYLFIWGGESDAWYFISRALPLSIINGCNVIALVVLEKSDKK